MSTANRQIWRRTFPIQSKTGNTSGILSCNCMLNYLYANLEGKHTGKMTCRFTFGEIAHQLFNQTLVRLWSEDV